MDLATFLQTRRPDWKRLEELLERVEGSGLGSLDDDQAVEFGRLFRRAASDLNQAQTFVSGEATRRYLNDLFARAYLAVYGKTKIDLWGLLRYLVWGYPAVVTRRTMQQLGGLVGVNMLYIQAALSNAAPQNFAPSSQGDMAHPPVDPKFDRQEVDYRSSEKPGTIVIDTPNHFLYLVEDNRRAMRYGIGVGRPGFTWQGVKTVSAKKEWPDWFPPTEMIQRRPDLPRWMAGGPENPLGARAMYLGSSLYRIHGSNEPWTIGGNVSSGCIRLRNADVIDLYSRVQVGTKVVVM